MTMMMRAWSVSVALLGLAGCAEPERAAGQATPHPPTDQPGIAEAATEASARREGKDERAAAPDAGISGPESPPARAPAAPEPSNETDPASDAQQPLVDGPAERRACVSSFGTALTTEFGRLDGRLVAIVPTMQRGCHADTRHLHLQVLVDGATYDVAVNVTGVMADLDAPDVMSRAWTEGWHPGASLDYVSDLGLHDDGFIPSSEADLIAALAATDHIALYTTGYGPGGAHLVHREGGSHDGAIVLRPLSSRPHVVAFRFTNQSF